MPAPFDQRQISTGPTTGDPIDYRSSLGAAALKGYRRAKRESMATAHPDDQESEVSDLIADLLHYAVRRGFNPGLIVSRAESNAGAEFANYVWGKAHGLTGADLAAAVQG